MHAEYWHLVNHNHKQQFLVNSQKSITMKALRSMPTSKRNIICSLHAEMDTNNSYEIEKCQPAEEVGVLVPENIKIKK